MITGLRKTAAGLAAFGLLTAALATPAIALDRPLVAGAPDSVGFSPERLARMDAGMAEVVRRGEVAGMVTLLARHGKIVDYKTYGRGTSGAMDRDALFRIYSMTKPITGVAMMMLYEEGRWRLDDPITKYLPELANLTVFKGVDAAGKPIVEPVKRPPTMRELMSHTAGFGYGLQDNNYVDQQFRTTGVLRSQGLKAMVDKIATIPLKFQPGERWVYSVAVDLQGLVVERLSGQTLGQFMQSRIFTPLKMRDTGFAVRAGQGGRLPPVYYFNPKAGALADAAANGVGGAPVQDFTKPPLLESGGGGLVSTTSDYARFCQMLLNGGELDGVRLLSPGAIKLMATNHLPDGVTLNTDGSSAQRNNTSTGFGLDFAVLDNPAGAGVLQGKGSYYWGGAASTWFWIDPANDVVFVGMVQRFGTAGPTGTDLRAYSQALAYSALTDPAK